MKSERSGTLAYTDSYQEVASDLANEGPITYDHINFLKSLLYHAYLEFPKEEAVNFTLLLRNHKNDHVNTLPALVYANRMLEPGKHGVKAKANPEGAARYIYTEALERAKSEKGLSEVSTYNFLDSIVATREWSTAFEVIRLLPYEKRLVEFTDVVLVDVLDPDTAIAGYKEFSDISKFNNKKQAEDLIRRGKIKLVRKLAYDARPEAMEMATNLFDGIYKDIAVNANQKGHKEFAKLAMRAYLNLAFSKKEGFWVGRNEEQKTDAVIHSLRENDWEGLHEVLNTKGLVEFYRWIRLLPENLTTSRFDRQESLFKDICLVVFATKYKTTEDLKKHLDKLTINLAQQLSGWSSTQELAENLFLRYPETKEAKTIKARRDFEKALKQNDFEAAKSLIDNLPSNYQSYARLQLGRRKLEK